MGNLAQVLPVFYHIIWQKQTVSENPSCALFSWERLEQGSGKLHLNSAVFFTTGTLIWIWWTGIAPSFPQLSEHILCLKFMGTGGTFVHINVNNLAYAIRDPHVASHMSAVQTFPWNLWAKELTVSWAFFWTATAEMHIFSTTYCHLCHSNALFLGVFCQVPIPTYALLLGGRDWFYDSFLELSIFFWAVKGCSFMFFKVDATYWTCKCGCPARVVWEETQV